MFRKPRCKKVPRLTHKKNLYGHDNAPDHATVAAAGITIPNRARYPDCPNLTPSDYYLFTDMEK